jgi:hypothetical protein
VLDGVVFALRTNGFLAYIPSFDIKGSVFLADKYGTVNIDPTLLKLPKDSGDTPSQGFTALQSCRAIPQAQIHLQEVAADDNDGTTQITGLTITAGSSASNTLHLHVPMLVQIRVSCDVQSGQSRLPNLRYDLVGVGKRRVLDVSSHTAAQAAAATTTTATVKADTETKQSNAIAKLARASRKAEAASLYNTIDSLRTAAMQAALTQTSSSITTSADTDSEVVHTKAKREKSHVDKHTVKGRRSFGGFTTVATPQATVFEEYGHQQQQSSTHNAVDSSSSSTAMPWRSNDAYSSSTSASAYTSNWDDSRERAAQSEASARIQREASKRRQYKKVKD